MPKIRAYRNLFPQIYVVFNIISRFYSLLTLNDISALQSRFTSTVLFTFTRTHILRLSEFSLIQTQTFYVLNRMVILSISLYFLTEHTIFEMWVAKYELCTVILRLSASFALFFSYARYFQIAFFCFRLHHLFAF